MSRLLILGGVAAIVLVLQALYRVFRFRNYPTAPGNRFGIWSHFWFMWKVWEGKFEVWNIDQHAVHGKIVRVGPQMYSIDDPDAVKQIYGINGPWLKTDWYRAWGDPRDPHHNLFSVRDTQEHATMRRKVAALYSMTAIKNYEPYVDNCVVLLRDQFDAATTSGNTIDLQNWMQCYAFDVVGELTFGLRVGFLESGGHDVDGIIDYMEKNNNFSAILGLDFRMLPMLFAIFGNPVTGFMKFQRKLVERRQRSDQTSGSHGKVAEPFYDKIEHLYEKDPVYFQRHSKEVQLITNVAAGSDTTSTSLTSTLFHLLMNPTSLDRLQREISDAIARGAIDDPITFDQAQRLPYLQMVLKEGMRLHPATGLPMWREVPVPGQTISGTFFPAGAIVGINTWVAHHNTTVFGPDAASFRPERWDPAVTTDTDQLRRMEQYYVPFGMGTRTCIGKNIAILEMCKLVPELIRRYDMTLVEQEMKRLNRWFVKPYDVRIRIKQRIS